MKTMSAILFVAALSASTQASILHFSFHDPVGDQSGIIDIIEMDITFDNATGDYRIVLTADEAHPFYGHFRININLFNPDTGTTARDPSLFEHNVDDYNLSSPLRTMVLTGTSTRLMSWKQGDRVATSALPFGDPDGISGFRSSIRELPEYEHPDLIAYGDFAVISSGDLTTGLVAYWPFKGGAADVSGNRCDGTVHGATPIPDWSGCPDSAYHFDGQNDYISIGRNVKPPLPLAISMWLRLDTLDKWICVFRNDQVNHGGNRGGLGVHIWPDGKIGTNLYEGFSAPWNRRTYHPTQTLLEDSDWHHVCIVYRNLNSILVYFDGNEYDAPFSDGSGSGMTYGGSDGAIGHHIGNKPDHRDYFQGAVDEVRVYNRALSSQEVALLLELPPCVPSGPGLIYVDDDAPNDPGPYDSAVSDPEENGTAEHPFDMIQEGIDAAPEGATVLVREGTYYETIEFRGQNIDVTSLGPDSDDISDYPVIDAGHAGTVVTFNRGEDRSCKLSGFVLTRGQGKSVSNAANNAVLEAAAAIACVDASPRIGNCVIVGNTCSNPFGGVIYCVNSDAVFENCTIADNYAGAGGAALYSLASNVAVSNCVVWNNMPDEIAVESGDAPTVTYTNVLGGWPGFGNVDVEPGFAFPGYWADMDNPDAAVEPNHPDSMWLDGDYHLISREGRWYRVDGTWVTDKSKSLCIDIGDPDSPWEDEPERNGGRINLGAYGGTRQASKSSIDCCLTITATEGGRVILPGLVEPGQTRTFCFGCGETATIAIEPDQDHHFIGWGPDSDAMVDPADANGLTFTVVVGSDISLAPVYTRTEAGPGGSIEFPDGPPSAFNTGTRVRILAKPDPCHHFTGWTGTAVDAGKVADPDVEDTTVLVDSDYTLIANFAPHAPSDLTTSSSAGGSIMLPGEGVFTYDCNTPVDVRAVPEPCYHFTGWTGTAVDEDRVVNSHDPNTTVTVDTDYTLIASFQLDTSELTISSASGGSVATPGEGVFIYDCGTAVTVEAAPEPCYRFSHWTGTAIDANKVADPNSAITTVVVDADYTLEAHFAVQKVHLTTSSDEYGSVVVPGEGPFEYDCGESVDVEAAAHECCHFVGWSGTAVVAGKVGDPNRPKTTVTMDGDYTLEASFAKVEYVLTIGSDERGSVTVPGEGQLVFDCGAVVAVEAEANEHCYFTGWTGTAVDAGKVEDPTAAKTVVTVDGGYTLQANFATYQNTVTFVSTEGGYVNLTLPGNNVSTSWLHPRTLKFDYGTRITLIAIAEPGYEFSHWSGTIWSTADYLFFDVEQDYDLTANFVLTTEP